MVTKEGASLKTLTIPHLPHDPGDRGWLGGGESYRWKDMWAQELHPGDACLPQVPAVLGRHMAGGPSRNQTGGWLTTLCVLLLREEAALKAWKSVKTGCLQSSWEEIPGGRHMTKRRASTLGSATVLQEASAGSRETAQRGQALGPRVWPSHSLRTQLSLAGPRDAFP